MPRSSRTVTLTAVALVVALLAPPPPARALSAEPEPARPDMTLEPLEDRVISGVEIYLAGRLTGPGPNRRPVVVEQQQGRRWVAAARSFSAGASGAYFVGVRTPRRAGPVTWRVVAPRYRLPGGGSAARVVSRTRTQSVVVQRISVTLPASVVVGRDVRARVAVRPFVSAQSLTLQQRVNGHWQYVGSRQAGRTPIGIGFEHVTSGPSVFRVRGPGGTSPLETMRGTPSDVVLPTRRVSTTSNGSQLNGSSYDASVSDDGRFVTFTSSADNAVLGDTNDETDVFLKDTATGTVRWISRGPRGNPGSGDSYSSTISGDGRYVAFVSRARNLDGPDINGRADLFVWERATDEVSRVGAYGNDPVLSRDGRYVAFTSADPRQLEGDDNETADVMVYDRQTASVFGASTAPGGAVGNARSGAPSISADGRYVAYETDATNLSAGGTAGVLLWDRTTGTNRVVATGPAGRPQVSADATMVAFESASTGPDARNQVYLRDLDAGTTTLLSTPDGTTPGNRDSRLDAIDADGSVVLFSSDADLVADDEDRDYCESEIECYTGEHLTDTYVADVGAATGVRTRLVSRSTSGAASDFFAEGHDLVADGSAAVLGSRDVLVPGQSSRSRYLSPYAYRDVFVRDLG